MSMSTATQRRHTLAWMASERMRYEALIRDARIKPD